MKRLLYSLFSTLMLVACTDSGSSDGGSTKPGNNPTTQPEITLNVTSSNFTTEGGSSVISFTAPVAWTAEVINTRADAWCKVEPTSGAAGSANITVTTIPNDTHDDRMASVVIKAGTVSKTISVSQKQKDALTITASKFEVGKDGGEVAIEVKSNIEYLYTVDDAAKEWITYKSTRAMQSSTLVFDVAKNESVKKREGKVIISSGDFKETVTIYQEGEAPSIVLNKNVFNIPSAKSTIAVEVKSNVNVEVELPTDAEWIVENTTRAMSTNTYYFDIKQNDGYDSREAKIKFTNKENNISEVVSVKQMQRDAIVVADSEYEFGAEGGELDFDIQTNVDVAIAISDNAKEWIKQVSTRALETKSLHFDIAAYEGEEDREGTITITGGNAKQVIKVKQSGDDAYEIERKALVAFYEALDGDNWTNNENWCSDKPVSEWYGIIVNGDSYVSYLNLMDNNLSGALSDELIGLNRLNTLLLSNNKLTTMPIISDKMSLQVLNMSRNKISQFPEDLSMYKNLKSLSLNANAFNCEIPSSIGELTNLETLDMADAGYNASTNGFTGEIPTTIGNLTKLKDLNLSWNKLTGSIPDALGKLVNLEKIVINANNLTGTVPESVMKLKCWPGYWFWILNQNSSAGGISDEGLVIPAPKFSEKTIEGEDLDYTIYSQNEYTILYHYYDWCSYSNAFTPELVRLYAGYKNKGLGVVAFSDEGTVQSHSDYAAEYNTEWPYILLSDRNCVYSYLGLSPAVAVVDKNGYVVFNHLYDDYNKLDEFLLEKLGEPDEVEGDENLPYASTDYSADGEVVTLQTATKGNGIDVIIMGDAYSDREIADGTYEDNMEYIYNNLFTEEPYKSFKDHFNVYYVNVVSKNEGYGANYDTKLEGYFDEGTRVGGNDQTVFNYGLKAISVERMDEALLIVAMNSDNYAGTCWMYYPSVMGDYGRGTSIAYFPRGGDATTFAQLLHHEACGHGFAKLADEYAYEENGTIPETEASNYKTQQSDWGWWKNVDFTSDATAVRWNYFINDTRYAYDGLGAYEGGLTYWTGVWRPTENSIMRYNTGGFNAPSREAIYYRIHKLAYGADWEYDYEEFVEWDARNRNVAAAVSVPYRREMPKEYKPTHPPVVVNKSWRDAK